MVSEQIPWVEKYRPNTLDEVISHEVVINTLKRFVATRNLPHILLHGPPGTGKTSTIKALAKELYGVHYEYMCLELNASDDRSIGVVRGRVKTFAGTSACALSCEGKELPYNLKLIILDEADQLTHDAQMALRRIIEDYAASGRFVIICNFVHKVAPALQSRCCKFRFPPLPENHIKEKLQMIAAAERVVIDDDAMDAFVEVCEGDLRRALNMLQGFGGPVTADGVKMSAGLPTRDDAERIWAAVTLKPFVEAFADVREVVNLGGYAATSVVSMLHQRLALLNLSPSAAAAVYPRLAAVEFRLASGADELMQLSDAVCAFVEFRQLLTKISA